MAATYSNGVLTVTIPLTLAQVASLKEAVAYALGPGVWGSLTEPQRNARALSEIDALLLKRLRQDVRAWLLAKIDTEEAHTPNPILEEWMK